MVCYLRSNFKKGAFSYVLSHEKTQFNQHYFLGPILMQWSGLYLLAQAFQLVT